MKLDDMFKTKVELEQKMEREKVKEAAIAEKAKAKEVANQLKAKIKEEIADKQSKSCLLYTSPSPRDRTRSRMPSSA